MQRLELILHRMPRPHERSCRRERVLLTLSIVEQHYSHLGPCHEGMSCYCHPVPNSGYHGRGDTDASALCLSRN